MDNLQFPPKDEKCPKDNTMLIAMWEMAGKPRESLPYYMCARTQHVWNLDGTIYLELTDEELKKRLEQVVLKLDIEELLQTSIEWDDVPDHGV